MILENYIKGIAGRIRLKDEQLEIRRYGLIERLQNRLSQNYPLDSFLTLQSIKRVLLINLKNEKSILRIESIETISKLFVSPSIGFSSPENLAVINKEFQVTRENSLMFRAEDRLTLNLFFDSLSTLFAEKGIQADFDKLEGMDDVRKDYDPPLKYYSGQYGETGFGSLLSACDSEDVTEAIPVSLVKEEPESKESSCPHCHHDLIVPNDTLGLNCPACEKRVIVRHDRLLTIEQAKAQAGQSVQKTGQAKSAITKETFDPNQHVAEYKRVCKQCQKVWHSLASREERIDFEQKINKLDAINDYSCCRGGSSQSAQRNQNRLALNSSLEQLKRCPECGSTNFTENLLYHEK